MKATGVTRAIDQLGRVVIPKELRDTMKLPVGTPMAFFTEADSIIMRKHQSGCEFCGSMHKLFWYGGKNVCDHCREDIGKLLK